MRLAIATGSVLLLCNIPLSGQTPDITGRLADAVSGALPPEDHVEEIGLDPDDLSIDDRLSTDLFNVEVLTPEQKMALDLYIDRYGAPLTLYELLFIEGFTIEDIRRLDSSQGSPDLKAATPAVHDPSFIRHELILGYGRRIEKAAGYDKGTSGSHYQGSPDKILVKYGLRKGDRIQGGITVEKDAGETEKKPDFTGGFLAYRTNGPIREIIIGDYLVHFGTGLTISLKRTFPTGPGRVFQAIKPCSGKTSSEENEFMRGIMIKLEKGALRFLPFFSMKKIDGVLEEGTVNGLPSGGLHRTVSELDHRKTIKETMGGININYKNHAFELGITGYFLTYDHHIDLRNKPYRQLAFHGKQAVYFGAFFRYNPGEIMIFGEISGGMDRSFGLTGGLEVNTGTTSVISFSIINISQSYYNPLSRVVTWGAGPGRQGLSAGFEGELYPRLLGAARVTIERQVWIGYLTDQPSASFKAAVELTWEAAEMLKMHLRYRYLINQKNRSDLFEYLRSVQEYARQDLRVKAVIEISQVLGFTVETNVTRIKKPHSSGERGGLLAVEVHFSPENIPLRLSLRTGQFDTDSYGSRLYSYERDTPHSMSIPAYFGKGNRFYLLIRWAVTPRIQVYFRGAMFHYPDSFETGSGYDRIGSNKKTDLKLMLVGRF